MELLDNEGTKHWRLGCDLLTSTAYHLQTNAQSEWTNQGAEIAVLHHVTQHSKIGFVGWTSVLPYL